MREKPLLHPIHFIGIDLAWSARNASGLAALHWDGDQAAPVDGSPIVATTDEAIVEFTRPFAEAGSVVIGIDAPLVVPNQRGQRPGEKALNAHFRGADAGAHPANRAQLSKYNGGQVRGEMLVRALASLGIRHDPKIAPREPTRQMFEVYPHPAMITLFGLEKTLKYKARHQAAVRREALAKYRALLLGLGAFLPPLRLQEHHVAQGDTPLKDYEDRLDALMCAYIALYYWYHGESRCRIFGDLRHGYIVAPVAETYAG